MTIFAALTFAEAMEKAGYATFGDMATAAIANGNYGPATELQIMEFAQDTIDGTVQPPLKERD